MITSALSKPLQAQAVSDWSTLAAELGTQFAERASAYDERGDFVHENYHELREAGLFSMAIPSELGGGGADYGQLADTVRTLGQHCGSTALAFVMHSHPVAANVFKHLRGDAQASATLTKIAGNNLIIAGTGANDWMESSGEAVKVEGGYRISAHKRFVSGAPGAQVFVTSVRYEGGENPEILHFATPFSAEGISLVETWDALGMRGTGSHDVVMRDLFVADDAIVARRPAGEWHPLWNVVLPTALPLITAAYVGLAEGASALAIKSAKYQQDALAPIVGEMVNALTTAQLALAEMVRDNDNHGFTPTLELANATLIRKGIAADAVKQTVELAAELVGGPGFFRGHAMERIVRDARAMHFHPLPVRRQRIFSGRVALGFDPVG